jgi:hypothetical protein
VADVWTDDIKYNNERHYKLNKSTNSQWNEESPILFILQQVHNISNAVDNLNCLSTKNYNIQVPLVIIEVNIEQLK